MTITFTHVKSRTNTGKWFTAEVEGHSLVKGRIKLHLVNSRPVWLDQCLVVK